MRGDVVRSIGLVLVVVLLSAASCEGGALPATLGLSVVPSELELERGEVRAVEVRVARSGAPGTVRVQAVREPDGVRFDAVDVHQDATAAPAAIEVANDAPLGVADLLLEASAGAALATALVQVRVVAPRPDVTSVALVSGDETRSVRQGAGSVTLRLEGAQLEQVDEASILGSPAGVGVASDGRLDVTWSVPHGAPLGPVDLRLLAADGRETVVADALTITPITAGPDGDDVTGRATPTSPVRSMTRALSLAAAGDEVLLLAGTYSAATGETWPSAPGDVEPDLVSAANLPPGVTLRGVDRDDVVLTGPLATDPDTESVALAAAGDAVVRDLRIAGFGRGVLASEGSLLLDNVHVSDVRLAAISAVARADLRVERSTLAPEGANGVFAYGGGRLTLVDSDVRGAFYGAGVQQSGTLRLERSRLSGFVGIVAFDDATVELLDSVVEDTSTIGITASDRTVLEVVGSEVRGANVGIGFDGRILRLRSSRIVDHRDVGLYVHGDPAVIDLGTATDPGLNVLTGSARYQLHDARPSDRTVVITVGGTVLGDEVPAPRLANGPLDEAPLLLIDGAGNKVAFE